MRRSPERWFGPAILIAFGIVLLTGFTAQLQEGTIIHGAGATFPAPLYARWMALFERAHKEFRIEYEAVGSGAGIDTILEKEVAFGASDARLSQEEIDTLAASGETLLQIPMVLGPVVVAYNLPSLVDHQLILDGSTLAGIYLGEIEKWNDPAIQRLNPMAQLPDRQIRVAHRADSSGTTAIFTDYLSQISPTWAAEIGSGKLVEWPVSSGAGNGNDGVAQQILLQRGGIGYVELKYADNAGLAYAGLVNAAGNIASPTVESVQAAEESTPLDPESGIKPSIVNAMGSNAYPIAGFTYLLVYTDLGYLHEPEVAEGLITYLEWSLTEGQTVAPELGYTPLPEHLRIEALDMIASIVIEER